MSNGRKRKKRDKGPLSGPPLRSIYESPPNSRRTNSKSHSHSFNDDDPPLSPSHGYRSKRKAPPPPPKQSSIPHSYNKPPPPSVGRRPFITNEPTLVRQKQSISSTKKTQFTYIDYDDELDEDDDDNNTNDNDENTITLPESLNTEQNTLQDLQDMVLLYQQAVHDVHQAIVDVKECSQDISYKIKSVTEQLHMIIDRREDELLDEITKKTASKIFALDSQFTKLTQRLMFCREARDEAEELLTKKHDEDNYTARKQRIMAIVNKAKQDAKSEFETELNRGTPVVTTRFHIEHYDITSQLERLGNIIDDKPLQQYQIYPPAITKTKAFKRSVRIAIKCREKIDSDWEHQVLSCQFEPQICQLNVNGRKGKKKRVSITSLPEHLSNPETLKWQSLGWIELNPAPVDTQMFGKSKQQMNELNKALSLNDDIQTEVPRWGTNNSAPMSSMSNLQKLKKELDLDHIVTQYTKLITGLNDILNDVDGKYVYIRVRMRKLVKFEEDIKDKRKHNKSKHKLKHMRKYKSTHNLGFKDKREEDDDNPPIWVESHFSRAIEIFETKVADDFDGDEEKTPTKHHKKKKKKKHKKRQSVKELNPAPIHLGRQHSVSSQGSLYDSDSEFSKQRRHSNYHIQDSLYQPGILLLEKSRIVWHDLVNNRGTIVSDAIPVAARSSCGMVVAHDVLVADDAVDDNDNLIPESDNEAGSRYTSIMFRIGGTLNKKADRSVDMLDLGTGMWSSLPSIKHARSQSQPALMNGNIVCAGGCGRKIKPISSVELFDFEEGKWRELRALKQARWGHAVYVMYYQVSAHTPSASTNSNILSASSSSPSSESAKLLVAGGWSKKKKNLQTAEIYDLTTNEWQSIAPMNVARSRCVAMEWTSVDRVGVVGGWCDSTKIVEYYDCNKDCWYRLNDLNHEHIYPSCGLLSDQHLYAMNRFLESDAKQIINERKTNHKISLMKGRPAPFVLGSNDQLGFLELFDDRTDQWIILQTFTHSQNNIISMIECALPSNVTSTLTQRNRGSSRSSAASSYSSQSSLGLWQRRGSKILGML